MSRFLTGHGVDCLIAVPSKLMRAPGDHVKNDKHDSLMLARMLSLGQVTAVRVPSEEQEALRDLSQARQKAARELARAKQRVNAFILRHGLYYPEKNRWTRQYLEWLRRQRFEHLAAQLTLEADLALVGMLQGHLKRLETQIIGPIGKKVCL